MSIGAAGAEPQSKRRLGLASLAALGVVFGDIGTSPLYTLKTVLDYTGPHPDAAGDAGALSLILWTLFIITTVKYVNFAMRIDNDGEGGIIALMTLLGVKKHQRPVIIAVGLFGAALIYGDGAITPAISVLSALEGHGAGRADPADLCAAARRRRSCSRCSRSSRRARRAIGRAFGPVMLVWFAVMALLGIYGIAQHPSVFVALNPLYGLDYLFSGGPAGLSRARRRVPVRDRRRGALRRHGPFRRDADPARLERVVFPSLILNYAGQAALVLDGAPTDGNIFYRLCPAPLLMPLIVLATVATIIASQSIITGAFSMTRQAIQLGWLPRLRIKQTSAEGYGQIYVGAVNWLLMIVTLGLTIGFGKSDNLAAAYGIAVSLTMLMTSVLLFIAMREIWGWSSPAAGAVAALFLVVDGGFFVANMAKVLDGGYVPLLLASARLWRDVDLASRRGAVHDRVVAKQTPRRRFIAEHCNRARSRACRARRCSSPAPSDGTPPVMFWHVKHNRSLHEYVLVLTLTVVSTPRDRPRGAADRRRASPKFLARRGALRLHGASGHSRAPRRMQGDAAARSISTT